MCDRFWVVVFSFTITLFVAYPLWSLVQFPSLSPFEEILIKVCKDSRGTCAVCQFSTALRLYNARGIFVLFCLSLTRRPDCSVE